MLRANTLILCLILLLMLTACGGSAAPATAPAATSAPAPTYHAAPLEAIADSQAKIEFGSTTRTVDDRFSTFAIDVDTGSYTAARNALTHGYLPSPQAVRVEEFINYFQYNYPAPNDTFGITIDAAPTPFEQSKRQIVRIGLQSKQIAVDERKPARLTFVIDISGSMSAENRLPLVKKSLRLLVEELKPSDHIAIVVYGDQARTVLDYTSAAERDRILRVIDSLQTEGSTNAEAGLRMAYKLAANNFHEDENNRIILCSDGVANVGATNPTAIRQSIRDYTTTFGIYLTTIGFGMGDYNDHLMEQLADDGNGNYAYVDTLNEAKRVFIENLTGTLQVIAKDAKIQVEFNPEVVSTYRLLGYENRALADSDFRNDAVDAGEVGAGHSVTALYEIVPTEQASGPALTVRVRYADPSNGEVHEIEQQFDLAASRPFEQTAPQFQLAVTVSGFAELLRENPNTQSYQFSDLVTIVERISPQLANDESVRELLELIKRADDLQG